MGRRESRYKKRKNFLCKDKKSSITANSLKCQWINPSWEYLAINIISKLLFAWQQHKLALILSIMEYCPRWKKLAILSPLMCFWSAFMSLLDIFLLVWFRIMLRVLDWETITKEGFNCMQHSDSSDRNELCDWYCEWEPNYSKRSPEYDNFGDDILLYFHIND